MNDKYKHIPAPPVQGREIWFIEFVEQNRDLGLGRMQQILEQMQEVDHPGTAQARMEVAAEMIKKTRKARRKK